MHRLLILVAIVGALAVVERPRRRAR